MRILRSVGLPCFMVLLCACSVQPSRGAVADMEDVTFETDDGVTIDAAFFAAKGDRVVVFAHGAVFDKESWYFLCERLQAEGIASVSINFRGYGKSSAGSRGDMYQDVLAAVAYGKGKGFTKVGVVGGSMGGAATLRALDSRDDKVVDKAVLLAPAGGPAITSTTMDKLFIVAEGDGLASRVRKLSAESAGPKRLEVVEGDAHAQHLFKTDKREALTQEIVSFMKGE